MIAPRPYTLVAELTYRCPLRCVYCSNPVDFVRARDELSAEEWRRTFTAAAALGVVHVHLSGGEPALRPDLDALIAHARRCGLYTNLITGGTLLDHQRLERLRDAGLDHVQLSLQDVDADAATRVAGAPGHAHKLAIARCIRTLGIPLTLNIVVHRLNIERLGGMIELAAELGAQRLELASAQFYGWALANRQALMPSPAQYARAEMLVAAAIPRHRGTLEIVFVRNDHLSEEPKPCMGGWGRTYLCVNPIGQVLPCHAAAAIPGLRFATVREAPLADIWRDSPAMNAFRGDQWMVEPCRSCPRQSIDFGGCRCQAYLLAGDPAAADPVCRLSPHHRLIAAARQQGEAVASLHYRDATTSRHLTTIAADQPSDGFRESLS